VPMEEGHGAPEQRVQRVLDSIWPAQVGDGRRGRDAAPLAHSGFLVRCMGGSILASGGAVRHQPTARPGIRSPASHRARFPTCITAHRGNVCHATRHHTTEPSIAARTGTDLRGLEGGGTVPGMVTVAATDVLCLRAP
jgi:hypothetical protein